MKRTAPTPDWRCHGEVVFRDVPPGRVPLTVRLRPFGILHLLPCLEEVELVERQAKLERTTFKAAYITLLEDSIRRSQVQQ